MAALLTAFFLDLWMGDPVYRYHPVRIMGAAISRGEAYLRARIKSAKLGGALLAFGLPLVVYVLAWLAIAGLFRVHFFLGWIAVVLGIYTSLSIKDLYGEAMGVYQLLKKDRLCEARQRLSRIVGRDTELLDSKDVIRGTVETVAESTLDGVVSPLFYAAIGGAPLALAYKAVNTLDSMIGHRNERYRDFGYWAAKQDEWMNGIPALLALFFYRRGEFFWAISSQKIYRRWMERWNSGLFRVWHDSPGILCGGLRLALGRPGDLSRTPFRKAIFGIHDP